MWSGALDSSGPLLPYYIISLASPITNILISTQFSKIKTSAGVNMPARST